MDRTTTTFGSDMEDFARDRLAVIKHDDARAADARARNARPTTENQVRDEARTQGVREDAEAEAAERVQLTARLRAQRMARDAKG